MLSKIPRVLLLILGLCVRYRGLLLRQIRSRSAAFCCSKRFSHFAKLRLFLPHAWSVNASRRMRASPSLRNFSSTSQQNALFEVRRSRCCLLLCRRPWSSAGYLVLIFVSPIEGLPLKGESDNAGALCGRKFDVLEHLQDRLACKLRSGMYFACSRRTSRSANLWSVFGRHAEFGPLFECLLSRRYRDPRFSTSSPNGSISTEKRDTQLGRPRRRFKLLLL